MGHRADARFFDSKRAWSRRKDLILSYYLTPYLHKVATLGRPICLVDGFAGPGRFGDGSAGSPLLIANAVAGMTKRTVPFRLLCIESDGDLYARLRMNLEGFAFAEAMHSRFEDQVGRIEVIAATHTLFLYLDPYTVEGIEWASLDRLFVHLERSRSSIELLLNLNAFSFARRGLAVLSMAAPVLDSEGGDADSNDMGDEEATPIASLNRIAGGDWWQATLKRGGDFPALVATISAEFCERLRARFREVCEHPVKEHWRHTVPKYSLVFGSRSDAALVLINDAVVKSREIWADDEMPPDGMLFEARPKSLVPDVEDIHPIVMDCGRTRQPRGRLIAAVIRRCFGEYSETTIRRVITDLISSGRMVSSTGKSRINDGIEVWRPM